jgi:hypothetical protein
MTLSLTCACGARLEIDDKFAGQPISCPDCQQALTAPAATGAPLRTSGFAVASFVLALVGAFTLVGTMLAVVLGALALVDIKRHRDQVTGRGYAVAGVVLGVLLTGLSLFAYASVELFGLDSLMREPQWVGKLDYPPEKEIRNTQVGYAITRPSEKWGVYQDRKPGPLDVQVRQNLLLVNVAEDAYLVCWPEPVAEQLSLEESCKQALRDFQDADLTTGPGPVKRNFRASQFEVRSEKVLPVANGLEAVEMVVDKSVGGQRRTYLVRVVRKRGDSQVYLVAAGTSRHRFARLQAQLRQGLDSFRVLDPRPWR